MRDYVEKIKRVLSKYNKYHWMEFVLIALILLFQYIALQYSSIHELRKIIAQPIPILLYNMALFLTLSLILYIFIQKKSVSFLISSIIIFVWTIANYFTVKYHGSPLFFSEFANMNAAMNVAGGYSYALDKVLLKALIAISVSIVCSFCLFLFPENHKWSIKRALICLVCTGVYFSVLIAGLLQNEFIKPRNSMTSYWAHGVTPYGMGLCVVEDVDKMINYLYEPEGYSLDEINRIAVYKNKEDATDYPDIILILNESFYDMETFIDTKSDVNALENFYGIENAIYGKALVPRVGGGTNNSEYELLTSNSLRLLRNEHPFNYLKMDKNKNNVVQYLNGLNYTTVAMHCRNGVNYSRHNGYPALGFDKSIIPYNNKNVGFYTYNKYGNREFLDKDNYADMIRAYNELGDGPRFMYLLTYQNHGWWEQNDSSLDTVHSSADLGANWLTRSMDEYLTSVQMSADAFKELKEYYKTVDRPVIICMVGDHAPAFIKELPDNGHSELENMFNQRAVPYVIWGNFPLETDLDTEYVSLFDLMPMISDICDMPLTTYQKTILDLHQDVPVVLSDGYYYTKEGKIEKIDKSSKYYDEIMKYYYMEYNSLGNQKDYRKELFELNH